jgi:hypothetical protein
VVEVRFIDRDAIPELRDELRIMGAPRVPVAVFLIEDFWEVARFGDRTLNVYRSKLAREMRRGRGEGVLSSKARKSEFEGWLDAMERVLLILKLTSFLRRKYLD